MIYKAKIINIDADEYEGFILMEVNKVKILTYYQVPINFIKDNIIGLNEVLIDIWLLDGYGQKIEKKDFFYSIVSERATGDILGKVQSIFSDKEYRLNCGPLSIDVENEVNINIKINDNIHIVGTFQIYFPDSDFNR